MKMYRVYLREVYYGSYDVEATSLKNARERVKELIANNELPYGVMDEGSGDRGYEVVGAERLEAND